MYEALRSTAGGLAMVLGRSLVQDRSRKPHQFARAEDHGCGCVKRW